MKIKKLKIRDSNNPKKRYIALFRKDTGELHIAFDANIDSDNSEEIMFDEDQYEVVRGDKVSEMFTGGKKNSAAAKEHMKMIAREHFDQDEIEALGLE